MKLMQGKFCLQSMQQDVRLYSRKGSLMQGVIMERIRPTYGEVLHRSELKPYSQYLYFQKDIGPVWVLNTLTQEASEEMWNVAGLRQLSLFRLSHDNCDIQVTERQITCLSEDDLLSQTFFQTCPRTVRIQFITPTSFKTQGIYQNYPTVRHLFQSLLNKFNAVSSGSQVDQESVLEDIEQNTAIIGYRLQSTQFSVEKVRIPSFLGALTLRINGPQQLVNLVYMLLRFGTYSGVGIKTAMGMGGMHIIEKGEETWKL